MDWENYLAYILLASDMMANFLWAFRQRKKNKHKLKIALHCRKTGKRNKFEAKSVNQLHGFQ